MLEEIIQCPTCTFHKLMNVLEEIHRVNSAWEEVSWETIVKYFHQAGLIGMTIADDNIEENIVLSDAIGLTYMTFIT